MTVAVGVDLGGTKTVAGLVSADGLMVRRAQAPTPASSGPEAVLDVVASLVRQVAEGAAVDVGVGTAGVVDASGVVVSATETFAGWVGTDVVAGLRRRLGPVEVAVVNDVDAHLLGESWRGAAAGRSSALMVAVGTGVGGALLLGGQLWAGAHHAAGEIGHVPVPGAEDLRCACGRYGHVEALAAGPAIAAAYGRVSGLSLSSPEVVARAEFGDTAAQEVVVAAATGLGRAVAGLVTAVDPDCVVVGGGVAEAGPVWWDALDAAIRRDLVEAFDGIPVVPAELGPDAAVLGAAHLVLHRKDLS